MAETQLHVDANEESPEDRLNRILAVRARHALQEAPDLLMHIRSKVLPSITGSGEGRVSGSKEPPAPLRLEPADDTNRAFASLIRWTSEWARVLGQEAPSAALVAWSRRNKDTWAPEALGFEAGIDPRGVHALTKTLTTWLLVRHQRIVERDDFAPYVTEVVQTLGPLRRRYPLDEKARPTKVQDPRDCPICREQGTIQVAWYSEDPHDLEVRCIHCDANTGELLRALGILPAEYVRFLSWLETGTFNDDRTAVRDVEHGIPFDPYGAIAFDPKNPHHVIAAKRDGRSDLIPGGN